MLAESVQYKALETNSAAYSAVHKKLRATFGSASKFKCLCNRPARSWAWKHDTDPNDIDNYMPMCNSCHVKYDDSGFKPGHTESQGVKHHKAKLTEQDVLDIRARYAVGDIKQYEIAKIYGVTQPTINAIINRKIWQHI